MAHNHKQVAGHLQVVAGGAAGLTEVLIMYPLDVVKTRRMLQVTGSHSGIVKTIVDIVREYGPLAVYRGILPPIFMEAPKRAVKFAANDTMSPILHRIFGSSRQSQNNYARSQGLAMLSGTCAGFTEAFIVTPFEKIKIKMQNVENIARYHSSLDCFRDVLRREGPLTLFKGLQATICCQGIWNTFYFGSIFTTRYLLHTYTTGSSPQSSQSDKPMISKFTTNLIAGSTGGFIGTIFGNPFDVTKSRVQNMNLTKGSKVPNTFAVLFNIAKKEGFSAWYKGFGPKCARLVPGGGILLAVFERMKEVF